MPLGTEDPLGKKLNNSKTRAEPEWELCSFPWSLRITFVINPYCPRPEQFVQKTTSLYRNAHIGTSEARSGLVHLPEDDALLMSIVVVDWSSQMQSNSIHILPSIFESF
ncbi:Hypothetical predicted protein [Olea europaea subsp. europaea]|uniref:Uncharacterized protein n=1 Tax=Olea europaea subsp. europaea TaxID=158383 RepID=A0A8S0V7J7_OLEEU|nr:Hypothetical predicted protein [Olea europaea subsp. europaea]